MATKAPVLSTRSVNLIEDARNRHAEAEWQRDQGTGDKVRTSVEEDEVSRLRLYRHVARLEARVGINVEDFTAFIGNGENSLGRFPANLTELHDALKEFEAK